MLILVDQFYFAGARHVLRVWSVFREVMGRVSSIPLVVSAKPFWTFRASSPEPSIFVGIGAAVEM